MSTAFTSLAIATGFERRYGVLKRLGTSPLPRSGLLAGKVVALLLVEVLQVAVISRRSACCSAGRRPPARSAGRCRRSRCCSAPRRSPRSACCSPARCAPRRRWPWPTSSTCCCSPAARSSCPPRRTARSATSRSGCRPARSARRMRDGLLDGGSPGGDLAVLAGWAVVGDVAARGRSRGSDPDALAAPAGLGRPWSPTSASCVTGGVVRLTGSGLGCPTWPRCTEESLRRRTASSASTGRSSSATGC